MKAYKKNLDAYKIKGHIAPCTFYLQEQGLNCLQNKSRQWAIAGLCPFHNDGSAGSFKVNCESGAFICFSCKEKGGDIIAYMQKKYSLSFCEALEKLANQWGVV